MHINTMRAAVEWGEPRPMAENGGFQTFSRHPISISMVG